MNDNELSALVAEHVAGWKWWRGDLQPFLIPPRLPPEANVIGHAIPPYATSADAVIPLLEKEGTWETTYLAAHKQYVTDLFDYKLEKQVKAYGETFPRSACLALLRAHGVTGI